MRLRGDYLAIVTLGFGEIVGQVARNGDKGGLSFNWRLVLAPHDVLDYVVVHEVCHLAEHHHGPEFWKLVESRRPNYRETKAWLDDHGWEILAYKPPLEIAA